MALDMITYSLWTKLNKNTSDLYTARDCISLNTKVRLKHQPLLYNIPYTDVLTNKQYRK